MKGSVYKNKILYFIEIVFFIFILFFIFFVLFDFFSTIFYERNSINYYKKYLLNKNEINNVLSLRNQIILNNVNKEIKIAFVGDIMLDRGVEQKVQKYGNNNFNFIFNDIKEDLKQYDFLIGNLEGPISNKGEDKHNLYSFRMNPEVIPILKEVGFDAVSVANNHMGDWGIEAMEDTFSRLDNENIKILGGGLNLNDAIKPKILEKNNTKIVLISFSEFGKDIFDATKNTAGISIISEENLREGIEFAREKGDIVIVNFHFGEEYQKVQNFYQENFAKMAIDFGADLVVGTHPHVIQSLERYKNSYISYSLGNFVFDQYFSPETMEGGLLEVIVKDKKIYNVILRKIKINNNYQPSLYKN